MENTVWLENLAMIKEGWNLEHDYLLLVTQQNERELARRMRRPGGCFETEYEVEKRLLGRLTAERDAMTRQYGEHPDLSAARDLRQNLVKYPGVETSALKALGIGDMKPWNLTLEWMYKSTCEEIKKLEIAIVLHDALEEGGPIVEKKLEETLKRALYGERERRIRDFGKDERLKGIELLRDVLKIRMAEEMEREISVKLNRVWPRVSRDGRKLLQLKSGELNGLMMELREYYGEKTGLKDMATPEAMAYALRNGLVARISEAGKDILLSR